MFRGQVAPVCPTERGARYQKAKLPFVSCAVVDGTLVAGQNPASAKEPAQAVAAVLG